MAFVTKWDGSKWDAAEVPEARLAVAWTDPATVREALAVMRARGGYCEFEVKTHPDGVEMNCLYVVIPLTGAVIAVYGDGREQRLRAAPPHPLGPETLTLEFSWPVTSHGYAVR